MQKLDQNLKLYGEKSKQHDVYVNNVVGDIKANPRDFYRYINSKEKETRGISPLKKGGIKVGSPNRNSRRRMNLMVCSWMSSLKLNITRSLL